VASPSNNTQGAAPRSFLMRYLGFGAGGVEGVGTQQQMEAGQGSASANTGAAISTVTTPVVTSEPVTAAVTAGPVTPPATAPLPTEHSWQSRHKA